MTSGNSIGPALELADITKAYPGVKALDTVSLTLERGEVLGLLGENGAGKSTLIKVISGVEMPDSGTFRIFGQTADIRTPRQAMQRGISVVHQERNLVPTFTVGENVLLERVVGNAARPINRRRIHAEALAFMEMVGLRVSPSQSVVVLSSAQQQLIEIARALSTKAKILLLDEPTASISLKEASALLDTIRRLRAQGTSIVYVSHKLEEVFEICDLVAVLRDGRNAGPRLPVAGLKRDALIEMMIGRAYTAAALPTRKSTNREPVLEVTDKPSEATRRGSSFTLHRGEILGWYGLVGSGRTELARAVIGADTIRGGSVTVSGRPARIRTLADALHRWRIGYVTENRQHEGLFLIHSVQRNIAATTWERLRERSPTSLRWGRAAKLRGGVPKVIGYPDAKCDEGGWQPERRQQAEGQSRQMARGKAGNPVYRRSQRSKSTSGPNTKSIRSSSAWAKPGTCGADLFRYAGDDPPCRPHSRIQGRHHCRRTRQQQGL